MKKTFIVIFIPLLLTQFVGAQTIDPDYPNNRWGLRGGLNFSKIDSDLGANTVRRRGIHAGVFYEHFFSDNFVLQPELQYSSEGWIKEDGSGETESRLHFANVTLVGKFFIFQGLNFQAGIQPALLIDGVEEGLDTYDIDDELKRFNISAVFGIGYDFAFGLKLGGRYVQGLDNINDGGYNANSLDNEIKTTNFQVYIGWAFAIPESKGRSSDE